MVYCQLLSWRHPRQADSLILRSTGVPACVQGKIRNLELWLGLSSVSFVCPLPDLSLHPGLLSWVIDLSPYTLRSYNRPGYTQFTFLSYFI